MVFGKVPKRATEGGIWISCGMAKYLASSRRNGIRLSLRCSRNTAGQGREDASRPPRNTIGRGGNTSRKNGGDDVCAHRDWSRPVFLGGTGDLGITNLGCSPHGPDSEVSSWRLCSRKVEEAPAYQANGVDASAPSSVAPSPAFRCPEALLIAEHLLPSTHLEAFTLTDKHTAPTSRLRLSELLCCYYPSATA